MGDAATVRAALSGSDQKDPKIIYLSPVLANVWLALQVEYSKRNAPIPADVAAEIVRKNSKNTKNPFSTLNNLDKRGVLQIASGSSSRRTRIPLTIGIVITTGKAPNVKQIWPVEEAVTKLPKLPTEPKTEAKVKKPPAPKPPALTDLLGEPVWVYPKTHKPVMVQVTTLELYKALLEGARKDEFAPKTTSEIVVYIAHMNEKKDSLIHAISRMEKQGLFLHVSGKKTRVDPAKRVLVCRPVQVFRHASWTSGETVTFIPQECEACVDTRMLAQAQETVQEPVTKVEAQLEHAPSSALPTKAELAVRLTDKQQEAEQLAQTWRAEEETLVQEFATIQEEIADLDRRRHARMQRFQEVQVALAANQIGKPEGLDALRHEIEDLGMLVLNYDRLVPHLQR
ncbi:hypothetical protein A3C09_01730 [Candidatus Uhrbacteria bacterium RIFCSPHIGHO2_02_FULL_47_44]|uniref:Uncharacterized protein n=1 Tax=Candidatus Uhrbacteria bacterium RIFCSPLOWO2_02_FULL_48_18 TaxID=1802408 RepID=A0A1F7V784_9BACT|nr:MAG: hypothetical protein A2839_04315 [Candidatus Uhrbacteria bacterium RIFCSPHIGHO2_01_FULL_47_10]OGL70991.1 MAG: hypothetical protein A3C09_01730 [Candidatus Uhrbacteria bacterium RIFCSPHIGHO2_02_FULL_47_44]OGL77755.1 MAG: hypothetical protein A3E97_00185 [Candidatus Uhrbacteria bacterium RIFCSPHIGHO2_12_FULL_47_12]OGL80513.1 MAG: hypothetical protein A3B20_03860 [Candidatus Uhrbacteria bacterium RIFCSPLOWO2_01_FULL_47_17]OGL86373.1 MAG: hypothetical protein A3I41_02340 [Candidatus Uhrbact